MKKKEPEPKSDTCVMCGDWADVPTAVAAGIAAGLHFGRSLFRTLCKKHYDLFVVVDDEMLDELDTECDDELCEECEAELAGEDSPLN